METAHGNVIDSFDAPDDRPSGLAWDGTHIWLCDTLQNVIYKLDTDGAIMEQYEAPGSYPVGLAFHGGYLWLVDLQTATIYKLDPFPAVAETPALGSWAQVLLIALLTAAGTLVGIVRRHSFR